MSTMKTNLDLIQWIRHDMSVKVFSYLDNPRDLIRASAVCRSWEDFVIENDLCKKLCLKMIPEVSGVVHRIETDGENVIEPDSDKCEGYYTIRQCLKRNHKVYAQLAFGLTPLKNNCISYYMRKRFANTLERSSSIGESDSSVPDNLVYINVSIHSFEAYFTNNIHMYSTTAVRFRLGCQRNDEENDSMTVVRGSQFIWSYTSPIFPMSREYKMQNFKLPEPVLCVGGILLAELFGRGRKDIIDDIFYTSYSWYVSQISSLPPTCTHLINGNRKKKKNILEKMFADLFCLCFVCPPNNKQKKMLFFAFYCWTLVCMYQTHS